MLLKLLTEALWQTATSQSSEADMEAFQGEEKANIGVYKSNRIARATDSIEKLYLETNLSRVEPGRPGGPTKAWKHLKV